VCNWCNTTHSGPSQYFCNECASHCVRECSRCHKPYPSLKYYSPSSPRCRACERFYNKQKDRRKKLNNLGYSHCLKGVNLSVDSLVDLIEHRQRMTTAAGTTKALLEEGSGDAQPLMSELGSTDEEEGYLSSSEIEDDDDVAAHSSADFASKFKGACKKMEEERAKTSKKSLLKKSLPSKLAVSTQQPKIDNVLIKQTEKRKKRDEDNASAASISKKRKKNNEPHVTLPPSPLGGTPGERDVKGAQSSEPSDEQAPACTKPKKPRRPARSPRKSSEQKPCIIADTNIGGFLQRYQSPEFVMSLMDETRKFYNTCVVPWVAMSIPGLGSHAENQNVA